MEMMAASCREFSAYHSMSESSSTCFISRDNMKHLFREGRVLLTILHDDLCFRIVLSTDKSRRVAPSDVLLPTWVFSAFQIEAGCQVQIQHVEELYLSPTITSNVSLEFIGYLSKKHWSECTGTIKPANYLIREWPSAIPKHCMNQILSVAMLNECLLLGAVLAVSLLDTTLVLKVDDINLSEKVSCDLNSIALITYPGHLSVHACELSTPGPLSTIGVSTSTAAAAVAVAVSAEPSLPKPPLSESMKVKSSSNLTSASVKATNFLAQPLESITSLIRGTFFDMDMPAEAGALPRKALFTTTNVKPKRWGGSSSVLVSGDRESGKSTLAACIVDWLQVHQPEVRAISISVGDAMEAFLDSGRGKRLDRLNLCSPDATLEKLLENLLVMCALPFELKSLLSNRPGLGVPGTASMSRSIGTLSSVLDVVLVLDGLTDVLAVDMTIAGQEQIDGPIHGSKTSQEIEWLRIVSALLRRILFMLSTVQSSSLNAGTHTSNSSHAVRLFVVGSCSTPPSQLQRYHQGSPEFDSFAILPKPTVLDRFHLIEGLLRTTLKSSTAKNRTMTNGMDDYGAQGIQLENISHLADWTVAPETEAEESLVERFFVDFPAEDLFTDSPDARCTGGEFQNLSMTRFSQNDKHWALRLAGLTPGFLPGDLVRLLQSVRSIHVSKSSEDESARKVSLSNVAGDGFSREGGGVLRWADALEALSTFSVRHLSEASPASAGNLGSRGQQQQLSWNSFGGYEEAKRKLRRLFHSFDRDVVLKKLAKTVDSTGLELTSEMELQANATAKSERSIEMMTIPKGIVLHGPPGCGKSFLAAVLAREAGMNFVSVRSTELLSKYFGQTESSIRDLFKRAREVSPCLLLFDDFDSISHNRSIADSGDGGDVYSRILSTFLNELDGIGHSTSLDINNGPHDSTVVVVVTCSNVKVLDDALVRSGRLSHHILLDKPTRLEVEAVVRIHLQGLPLSATLTSIRNKENEDSCTSGIEIIVNLLLERFPSPSCAVVAGYCRRAVMCAIRQLISTIPSELNESSDSIDICHFMSALDEL